MSEYKVSLKSVADLDIPRLFEENPDSDVIIVEVGKNEKLVFAKQEFLDKFSEPLENGKHVGIADEIVSNCWGLSMYDLTNGDNKHRMFLLGSYLKVSRHASPYRVRFSTKKVDRIKGEVRNAQNFLKKQEEKKTRKFVTVHAL